MLSGTLPISSPRSALPPVNPGWMFMIAGSVVVSVGWAAAICLFITGRKLKQRRGYLFCLITAGIACLFQPFGMVLGVFTFIVLLRPSVKAQFQGARAKPLSAIRI